jgi:hypothetical protein
VNANQFLEIITKKEPLEIGDILQLKKVQENFPYFQIPFVLVARYDFIKDPEKKSPSLGYAAVNSPDRTWLKKLVEKSGHSISPVETAIHSKEEFDLVPQDRYEKPDAAQLTQSLKRLGENLKGQTETKEQFSETQVAKEVPKRRKLPADDLIETIKKREKKVIVDSKMQEQINLIKEFSKKEIKLATIKEIEANHTNENLAATSTQMHDHLISESFAKLLGNQGKKKVAKEIYQKLILKFPDKRAYFADLIENLKD